MVKIFRFYYFHKLGCTLHSIHYIRNLMIHHMTHNTSHIKIENRRTVYQTIARWQPCSYPECHPPSRSGKKTTKARRKRLITTATWQDKGERLINALMIKLLTLWNKLLGIVESCLKNSSRKQLVKKVSLKNIFLTTKCSYQTCP